MTNNPGHDFLNLTDVYFQHARLGSINSKQYQFLLRKALISSILLVRPPMLSHLAHIVFPVPKSLAPGRASGYPDLLAYVLPELEVFSSFTFNVLYKTLFVQLCKRAHGDERSWTFEWYFASMQVVHSLVWMTTPLRKRNRNLLMKE